jgi:hypothetical protein
LSNTVDSQAEGEGNSGRSLVPPPGGAATD